MVADRQARLGPEHALTLQAVKELATAQFNEGSRQLKQQKYGEAEALLRPALAVRTQHMPDVWTTFASRSVLGGALAGQKKYAEAEPLLVSGFEGMQEREGQIPANAKARLSEGLERLVQLYDDWGKPEEADKWRPLLPAKTATAAKP